MMIHIEVNGERDVVSVLTYIERTIDTVVGVLTETKKNLDINDEFSSVFNLLLCKNKLSALLSNLTDTE